MYWPPWCSEYVDKTSLILPGNKRQWSVDDITSCIMCNHSGHWLQTVITEVLASCIGKSRNDTLPAPYWKSVSKIEGFATKVIWVVHDCKTLLRRNWQPLSADKQVTLPGHPPWLYQLISFTMMQGRVHERFGQEKRSKHRIYSITDTSHFDYPRWKAKNRWHSADAHLHDGAGNVPPSLFPLNMANTMNTHRNNQIPSAFPELQDSRSLTLRWRSFSECVG